MRGLFLQLQQVGLSICSVRASHCNSFSCCRAQAVEYAGFGSCSSQALEHRLNTCGSWADLLLSMWDLPRPGIEPVSPALAGRFFTTEPTGKPPKWHLKVCNSGTFSDLPMLLQPAPFSRSKTVSSPLKKSNANEAITPHSAPGNPQQSIFCLYGFVYSGYFIETESQDVWPFVFGLSLSITFLGFIHVVSVLDSFVRLNNIPLCG